MEDENDDRIRLQFEENRRNRRKAAEEFWADEYTKKTFDEKIKYWSGYLNTQMRWNGESGVDEMAVFSKESYEYWKAREPIFDELLPHVIRMLRLSSKDVYSNIKR